MLQMVKLDNTCPRRVQNKSHFPFNFKQLLCLGVDQVPENEGHMGFRDRTNERELGFDDPENEIETHCHGDCPFGMHEVKHQHVQNRNRICVKRIPTYLRTNIVGNMKYNFTKNTATRHFKIPAPQLAETFQKNSPLIQPCVQANLKHGNTWSREFYNRIGFTPNAPNICKGVGAQQVTKGEIRTPVCEEEAIPVVTPSHIDNTQINSNELYNSLFAHFNKFCDEMLVKNGFAYGKNARRKRFNVREMMTRNLVNVIENRDMIADNVNVNPRSENTKKSLDSESKCAMCKYFSVLGLEIRYILVKLGHSRKSGRFVFQVLEVLGSSD